MLHNVFNVWPFPFCAFRDLIVYCEERNNDSRYQFTVGQMISGVEKNKQKKQNKRGGGGGGALLSKWHPSRDRPRESMRVSHRRKESRAGDSICKGPGVGSCLLGSRNSKERARGRLGQSDKEGTRNRPPEVLWLLP